jgi:hypothetical protein
LQELGQQQAQKRPSGTCDFSSADQFGGQH